MVPGPLRRGGRGGGGRERGRGFLTPARLFVYGSLRPGGPNHHVLSDVPGRWQAATVRGRLKDAGWGAEMGYPAIVLDDDADPVRGDVLVSDALADRWETLDRFEGDGYERVRTSVELADGGSVEAWIYVLSE